MKIVKVIKVGNYQVIEIPKEFEFKGVSELIVEKEGNSLVLKPKKKAWLSLVNQIKADDDFLVDRKNIF